MKNANTSLKSLNSQSKDNNFITQLNKVYQVFFKTPSTMKEVDAECGVMRESICRYVKTLRSENKIYLIDKRICKVTKHIAGIYTTNPDLIPFDKQTKLL